MAHYYSAYLNIRETGEELYSSISDCYYSKAVKISAKLSEGHHAIISDVVSRLAQENNPNLLSYCYQLWNLGQKGVVSQCFPGAYYAIFSEDYYVTVIGKKFDMAIKLDSKADGDGDRAAFGDVSDKTSNRVKWQVLPFWVNNKVHFKFKNFDYSMMLKMSVQADGLKDRAVFGANSTDEDIQYWELVPMVLDGGTHYFYIANKQFSQGLKLAETPDSDGDRKVFGHNGNFKEDPHRFAWRIDKFPGNYLSLSKNNKK